MSDPVTRLNAALEGRYAIERELGEGGMATVYLADDLKHERKVALKVLKPELAAVVGAERFLAEIKTTAKLQHPHILPLFDSGEADTFLFYVMPYVDGETLRDRIDREKQLPVDEAVRIATAVANALDHAHRHNVIHRDIKPGNILLQDGEPIVADFGIALAVGAAGSNRLTETGLSLGTPFYMSPEQATGDRAVGASTDTYALGAVLYEMLVGEPPYPGTTAQAVLGKIIAGKPVSATEQRPLIPANVDAALRRALEKLPADRFSSAQEFVRALGDTGFRYGEVVAAGDASAAVSSWNRLTVSMTGLAALSTVLAVVFGWVVLRPQSGDIEPIRFVAQLPDSLELLNPYLSFTPDGTRMVMPGGNGPVLRALGDVGAYVIDIGKRAGAPFLSPTVAGWPSLMARLSSLRRSPSMVGLRFQSFATSPSTSGEHGGLGIRSSTRRNSQKGCGRSLLRGEPLGSLPPRPAANSAIGGLSSCRVGSRCCSTCAERPSTAPRSKYSISRRWSAHSWSGVANTAGTCRQAIWCSCITSPCTRYRSTCRGSQ